MTTADAIRKREEKMASRLAAKKADKAKKTEPDTPNVPVAPA